MTRGDQRERDRAKTLAKAGKDTSNQREGTVQAQNEGDKAALLAKVQAKRDRQAKEAAEQDAAAAAAAKASAIAAKAPKKKDAGLDDLLSAGLAGDKTKKKKNR